ncbi:8366_t:CDS:2, partial [Entrophospora sp. SA101]
SKENNNDDIYGSIKNALKFLNQNNKTIPVEKQPSHKHSNLYIQSIIYINALDNPLVDQSLMIDQTLINKELEQIITLKEVSPFLPAFLGELEIVTKLSSWYELEQWARKKYFSDFADIIWPDRSVFDSLIVNYLQDILIHYSSLFQEPYHENLCEGDVHDIHILPLTKLLRRVCKLINGERFSEAVKFRINLFNKSNHRGHKTDLGGEISGFEVFTFENSYIANEHTKKFKKDELKIACYTRDDLIVLWQTYYRKAFSVFSEFETYLMAIRTWGAQLSGTLDGNSGLHLSIYSTRQVTAGLFFFLMVDSEPLPRKETGVGYASLSACAELVIRLMAGIQQTSKIYLEMDKLYRGLSRQNPKKQSEKRVYLDEICDINSLNRDQNIKKMKQCSKNDDIMESESDKKRCGVCNQRGHNARTCLKYIEHMKNETVF